MSLAYPSNGVQNGAPDGVALVNGSSVVQFLSYEGTFTGVGGAANGLLSTDIGVAEAGTEAVGLSIGLTGTGTTYGDFTWTTGLDDSPAAPNPGQTFGEVGRRRADHQRRHPGRPEHRVGRNRHADRPDHCWHAAALLPVVRGHGG